MIPRRSGVIVQNRNAWASLPRFVTPPHAFTSITEAPQPLPQLGPPSPAGHVAYRDRDRLPLPDQDHEPLSARDARIEKIPLQHGVVLSHHRDDDRRILRPLRFVDRGRVGRDEGVELAEAVGDSPPIEAGDELAGIGVHIVDGADVAVVDLLVIVVLDLHDLVTRREGPAESLDLPLARGVEGSLQLDVE
jgi:hypothetical protein